jgi:DNA mismatch repair protein MutL
MTARISLLPSHVIGQIAAGEVVERPASVVKELVENSLDAGARSIDVSVAEGGRDLIRVVDDGAGIAREDLPLAVASHATSKIQSADDLFRVKTMGFRGEALASIAGVSDFRLQSRPAEQETAARIEVRQGEVGAVQACGGPLGTQIEVRQLFASVPVRRKFLKSKQTELSHISETLIRLALARPGIDLKLSHNDRTLYHRPADMDLLATIDLLFGSEISKSLLSIRGGAPEGMLAGETGSAGEGLRIEGFVGHPEIHRPTQRYQYLFVNGRFIRDRSLGHAVQEAYRGLILSGRYPVSFLFLTVPAEQVDVNVHPTKIEVRFEEPRQLYSLILSTLRERFLRADLSSKWSTALRDGSTSPAPLPMPMVGSARSAINEEFSLARPTPAEIQPSLWRPDRPTIDPGWSVGRAEDWDDLLPGAEGAERPPQESHDAMRSSDAPPWEVPTSVAESMDSSSRPPIDELVPDATDPSEPAGPAKIAAERLRSDVSPDAQHGGLNERVRAIQVHNSYLVVETDEGMMLVDQHALHERILYEHFRARVASQGIEVQELLVPEPIDLTPLQTALLLDQKEVLAELGLGIEEFGDRCVLIQRHPALLGRMTPAELVREIASRLEETGRLPSRDEMLQNLLHMMACKAAVKAGDPLTAPEIESLVRQRHLVDDSHHCPHGRPTVLRFTLNDLEREFQRK